MTNVHRLLLFPTVLILALLAGCTDSGPAGTVEKFHHHVEDGEIEEAAEMFSGEIVAMFGRDKLESRLSQQTREISRKGGIQSLDIVSEEVSGQVADVRVRVTYGNGRTDEQDVQLTKIDGEWKLTPKMQK